MIAHEGSSSIGRSRLGFGCAGFARRLRRRFRLEYRIHGRPDEFKRDAKRYLSLTAGSQLQTANRLRPTAAVGRWVFRGSRLFKCLQNCCTTKRLPSERLAVTAATANGQPLTASRHDQR